MPQQIVYFLHIPKTAGSSLTNFLEDHFDLDTICKIRFFDELVELPRDSVQHFRLYCGHFGAAFWEWFGKETPHITITTFRDPIERAISTFNHICNPKNHHFLYSTATEIGIDEFCQTPAGALELANLQTRFIAFNRRQHIHEYRKLYRESPAQLLEMMMNDNLLTDALNNFKRVDLVGVHESLPALTTNICQALGWPEGPSELPFHNVGVHQIPNKYSLSQGTLNQLAHLNQLDTKLYSEAVLKSKQRVPSFAEPRRKIEHTQYWNFKRALHGIGWHGREISTDNRMRRWTGPGNQATIYTGASRVFAWILRLKIGSLIPDNISALSGSANGCPIEFDIEVTLDSPPTWIASTTIPSSASCEKPLILELKWLKSVSSAEFDKSSSDERLLGLYVYWLELTPQREIAPATKLPCAPL